MVFANVFLISGNYIFDNVKQRTKVILYCKTEMGNVIKIEDYFNPYLYIEDMGWRDLNAIREMKNSIGHNIVISMKEEFKKDEAGKNIKVHKVEVLQPSDVPTIRKYVERARKRVFSADILYPLRYIYDKNFPSIFTVKGDLFGKNTIINPTFGPAKQFVPRLKTLVFDIENSLKDEKRIYVIGVHTSDGKSIAFAQSDTTTEVDVIQDFFAYIREYDPDIISGYNIDGYDWPTIYRRCMDLQIPMYLGRDGSNAVVHYSNEMTDDDDDDKMEDFKIKIVGRVSFDAFKLVRLIYKPWREDLDYVAKSLKLEGKTKGVDASQMDKLWIEQREDIIKYCLNDCKITYDIITHPELRFIDSGIAMADVGNTFLEEAMIPVRSRLIDRMLIPEFEKDGWATPCHRFVSKDAWDKKKEKSKYKGAIVLEPTAGLYKNVIVLDFKSMYPSQIIEHNICYTTYSPATGDAEEIEVVDNDGNIKKHKFLKSSVAIGIIPRVIKRLLDYRDSVKAKMKDCYAKGDKATGDYYNSVQESIKILANASYGVFGTNFYRYTNIAIAESITACARTEILKTFDIINKLGYQVLHSHTDSVFISAKENMTVDDMLNLAKDISSRASSGNTVLQVDKIFKAWFNHGAQTAYFGKSIWPKEEYVIRGYATRRRDSCELQRDYLDEAMKIILDGNMENIYKFFSKIHVDISNAKEKGFDRSKLIFTKTVKDEEKYDNPDGQAGVKAVRKYKEFGYPFIPGQRISWIVTGKEDGRLDVEPVIEGKELPQPDVKHYIERIVKTLEPISEVFGFDRVALKTGKIQARGWFDAKSS